MSPPHVILSASFDKLSGSRVWLHKVKTPRWKPKQVWLTSSAHIHHSPDLHLADAHLPTPGLLILPGGARRGTYSEQIKHARQHIFVVTAVYAAAHADRDAKRQILYFSANNQEEVTRWVDTAVQLSLQRMGLRDGPPFATAFLPAWGHAHKLKLKEVLEVARDLNFKLTEDRFRALSEQIHGEPVGKDVFPDQFAHVMTKIAVDKLLQPIFNLLRVSPDLAELSPDQIGELFAISCDEAAALLARHGAETCSPALLLYLLYHPDNAIIDPPRANALHDMNQPLNRYCIASSHNTYLTGDQLKSNSSADMYRIVLERGCRCVEIDAWDGDDGVPIVKHGHTMTSPEKFEKVLRAIKEHSFSHGNPYPVIVSIESHLCKPQQLVAAELIKSVLGEYLHVSGPEHRADDVLPSPASLKNKIIIKGKTGLSVMRPEYREGLSGEPADTSGDFEDDDSDDPTDSTQQLPGGNFNSSKVSSATTQSAPRDIEKVNKITPEFAEIVFLAGGNRKKLMALWKTGISGTDRYLAASCVSINEKKVSDVYMSNAVTAIREYNSHGMTRVYPKGSRVDSSNYFPIQAQFLGCQIVALNWQAMDTALAINQARFTSNGGRGYVLPAVIPEAEKSGTLSIQLLSAFLLPKAEKSVISDIIDSYCTLKLYDTVFEDDDECCSFAHETKATKSNGFNPLWQESMTIPVRDRELAVLNFKVWDKDRTSGDEVVGYRSVPVSLLRPGLRSVPLNTKDGMPMTIAGTSLCPSILCNVLWV